MYLVFQKTVNNILYLIALSTTILAYNQTCGGGVAVFNINGILKFFYIVKHRISPLLQLYTLFYDLTGKMLKMHFLVCKCVRKMVY